MSDQFTYHVFLSHSSEDKAAVRELAQRLKGDGLRVWPRRMKASGGAGSARSISLAIEQGLESSPTLVAGLSQAAFASERGTLERHTELF